MKTKIFAAVVVALGVASVADARPRPAGHNKKFEANKTFGLGLELGEPTSITGKLFVSPSNALDFGVGTIYHDYYGGDGGLHLYADYLWHPAVLTSTDDFELPFYIGVGGRFWDFNYACNPQNDCTGAAAFGVRMPIGVTFDFNNVPLDVFIQIVPTLDFFHDYATHDIYLDFDFSVGIRYWFS